MSSSRVLLERSLIFCCATLSAGFFQAAATKNGKAASLFSGPRFSIAVPKILYKILGTAIENLGPENKEAALPFFVAAAWKNPADNVAQQKIKDLSSKTLEELIAQPNAYVQ